MNLKRDGIPTGLGDRIGCYLIFSMLGYIYDKTIYTTWIYNNIRGGEYPSNILEYINFPNNLKFVSQDEFDKLEYAKLEFRWVYHAFDQIPETMYKSLYDDKQINCSYEEMLRCYKKACSEMFYKKTLPGIITTRPGIIHIRRDDKGCALNHTPKIINLLNDPRILKICQKFIITTDDSREIAQFNDNKIIKVEFSENIKIRTLEEFFVYSHCKIIIQSVGSSGKGAEVGSWGGWSGFSYIPFQLGLTLYPNDPPIFISLSEESENTRLTCARKYADRPLFNVLHYHSV